MTIHVFAICYNEAKMLPFFIEHYKSLGAEITIYDNESTDGSQQIILENGCNLISWSSNSQIRDDLYLNIKNNCWKGVKSEWVIICDVDEFVFPTGNLDDATIVRTQGYDMLGWPPSKLGAENNLYSKSVMFRPAEMQEINYRAGCHSCSPIGNVYYSSDISTLLHYKYTYPQTVYERHLVYQSRLSDINKKYEWGIEYQQVTIESIYDKFQELQKWAKIQNPQVCPC